jgi:hypothetical protein
MKKQEAVGKRHIIITSKDSSSFKDWALTLSDEFKPKNYSIPTTYLNYKNFNYLIEFLNLILQ